MPALAALFAIFAVLRFNRLLQSCLFVVALHGFRAVEPVFLSSLYFVAIKRLPRRFALPFSWIFAVATLIWLDRSGKFVSFPNWMWQGALPRWNNIFKISLLRILSFGFDFHDEFREASSALDCERCSSSERCGKCRSTRRAEDFSFASFFAFVFYPPLYLSGPIMTFNDFWWQNASKRVVKVRQVLIYGARWLASWLCLEVLLHLFHVCAIKSAQAWSLEFTPQSYAGVAFLNLKIIWLKLLVIWRFARFFALFDGIDPPENMNRCMSNNYSALMFWRSWHRSFNQWIVRYLYVPLGGNQRTPYNLFPVFTFVALWHDVNWQLAAWGCLIPVFILPEVACKFVSKRLRLHKLSQYRQLAALAAALNIYLMMIANLVGFGVGIEGTKLLVHQVFGESGVMFVFSTFLVFYAAVNLMFEIREEEFRRNGHYLSY
jgi:D-alanyl-lipoteichoic acid acyltransferase DltB (MBOAT superfamily)